MLATIDSNTLYGQEGAVGAPQDLHLSRHAARRRQRPEDVRKGHRVRIALRGSGGFHLHRRCEHSSVDSEAEKRALDVLVDVAVDRVLPVENSEEQVCFVRRVDEAFDFVA